MKQSPRSLCCPPPRRSVAVALWSILLGWPLAGSHAGGLQRRRGELGAAVLDLVAGVDYPAGVSGPRA